MAGKAAQKAAQKAASSRRLELFPIKEAPVKIGEKFGPCLLDRDADWVIGYWNGHGWFGLDGFPLHPAWWGLLSTLTAPILA